MTDLVVRSVPGDQLGYCTVTTTWRPARPGDTPGGLVPEHGPTQPVDLATRPGLDPTVPGDQLAPAIAPNSGATSSKLGGKPA